MSVDETFVHDIVKKVMANMQITGTVSGMHGVFKPIDQIIIINFIPIFQT